MATDDDDGTGTRTQSDTVRDTDVNGDAGESGQRGTADTPRRPGPVAAEQLEPLPDGHHALAGRVALLHAHRHHLILWSAVLSSHSFGSSALIN